MYPNSPIRIGIIYLAIGIYEEFWKDFYPTCECFFCPEAEKGYEVFTDSPNIPVMNLKNVTCYQAENKGFIQNASAKSAFVCSIAERLRERYDYVFYLNANYKFLAPVSMEEVLPGEGNDGLTVLSFNLYRNRPADKHPYDRNPDCHAYIPTGQGERYYQSGFYGGKTEAFLRLSNWCRIQTEKDLSRKVIALWHDESYVNRYLLDLHPRIVNETYGYADYMPPQSHKAIFLNKEKYLGNRFRAFKDLSIDNSISFLLDDKFQPQKIAIVQLWGGLGDQLFQYAYFLWLRKQLAGKATCYLQLKKGYAALKDLLPLLKGHFISPDMEKRIAAANPAQTDYIKERSLFGIPEIQEPSKSITFYKGNYSCASIPEAIRNEIEDTFKNVIALESPHQSLKDKLMNECSVGIYIPKNDDWNETEKELYGSVCTSSYYRKAQSPLKKNLTETPVYYIFSDDPQWAENKFGQKGYKVVNKPINENALQDLFLISSCKHYIISNNPFSWWAAWFGKKEGTQTIIPGYWYRGVSSEDMVVEGWITINWLYFDQMDDLSARLLTGRLHNSSDKTWWNRMKRCILCFHLWKSRKKRFYKCMAEEELEEIVQHMGYLHNLKEFIWVASGILYLYEEKFVSGEPNDVMEEIDRYLMALGNCKNKNLEYCHYEAFNYFIRRIGLSKRNVNLIRMFEQFY